MIFIHSDDYGISDYSADIILNCIKTGSVNSVSLRSNVANLDKHINKLKAADQSIRIAVHLDLTEGKCLADKKELFLLTDEDGYFNQSFISLWLKYIFASKNDKTELKKQIRLEMDAQIKNIRKYTSFSDIDTHQHIHMVPFVFDIIFDLAQREKASLRLPYEPSLPFIRKINLWLTYNPVNILKHILLNALCILKRLKYKKSLTNRVFFGVIFSGKMNFSRVKDILPEMIYLSKHKNVDLDVLFHPCPMSEEEHIDSKKPEFEKYYKSYGRILEKETVISQWLKNIVNP